MSTPAPARLGTFGAQLWRDVTGTYDLRPDELRVLEDACRERDLIARMESELEGAELMVAGSMGQSVLHPMVSELRQHRATHASLMRTLKLPDSDDKNQHGARSSSARAAAQARWGRGA